MTESNGRWKLDPQLIWVGAVQLIALGIATGILIGRLAALEVRVTNIAATSVTRSEVALALSAANRENDLLWAAIDEIKKGPR